MGMVFLVAFPLSFIANTFVASSTMPEPLATIAQYNPVSAMTAAVRACSATQTSPRPHPVWPMAHPVAAAILWSLAILAVCVPLAIRRYRTVSAR